VNPLDRALVREQRIRELERIRYEAEDEETARAAAEEIHVLMDEAAEES
jgi:hypothetical protein